MTENLQHAFAERNTGDHANRGFEHAARPSIPAETECGYGDGHRKQWQRMTKAVERD